MDDHQLLARYAAENSEAAFTALVARHLALVYSSALRHAGNAGGAEEITSAVFIILARKAGSLSAKIILPGWLYQTTRLTAANYLRTERRRQQREHEAFMQSTLNETDETRRSEKDAAWRQIAPLLDDALATLRDRDRDALVLRFFENKSTREIASALRVAEPAAHKRVTRALEKLRKFFTQRGVTLTATAIVGAVSANSVQAAPVALVKIISVGAFAKGAAAGGSTLTLVKGALKIMAWTKAKMVVVVGMGVLLAGGGVFVAKEMTAEKNAFEAEGFLEFGSGGKWTNQFKIFVKGDKWLIRTTPQNSPVNYYEDSYDGSSVYHFQKIGDRPDSEGSITASGVVEANDIPYTMADYAVPTWLAFGSARFFDSLKGNEAKPFFNWAEPFRSELKKLMAIELKRSDRPPYVATFIYCQEMNRRYRAIEFTNFNGLLVPSEFSLECFQHGTGLTNPPNYSVRGVLTKISKLKNNQRFRPTLHGRTYIQDFRFSKEGSASYVNTSQDWFATNSPQWQALSKMYDYKSESGGLVWPRIIPKIDGVQP